MITNRVRLIFVCLAVASATLGLRHNLDRLLRPRSAALKKCGVLSSPSSVFAQSPTILWSADMENSTNPGSGLQQWYAPNCCDGGDVNPPISTNNGGGVFNSGRASAGPSLDFSHAGSYSAKLTVDTAVESGTRLFRWLEPRNSTDLYYRTWYYFPQIYTPSQYWNVFQWKSKHPAGDDPFFILNVGNRSGGAMYFYLYNWQTRTSYGQNAQNITAGQWTHVEAHYICAGGNTGHVTFWQDGVQIFDIPNVQTRYSDGDCEWSVNNYSNGLSPNPATIYIDDAAICSGGRCN